MYQYINLRNLLYVFTIREILKQILIYRNFQNFSIFNYIRFVFLVERINIFEVSQIYHQLFLFFENYLSLPNDSRYKNEKIQEKTRERKWKRKSYEFLFSSSLFFFSCRATLMEEQRSIFHANGVPLKYSIHRVTRACPPSSCRVHSSAFFFSFFLLPSAR